MTSSSVRIHDGATSTTPPSAAPPTPRFRASFAQAAAAAAAAMRSSADELPALALPPLELSADGAPSDAADFVTGSVGLNRMQRRCSSSPRRSCAA